MKLLQIILAFFQFILRRKPHNIDVLVGPLATDSLVSSVAAMPVCRQLAHHKKRLGIYAAHHTGIAKAKRAKRKRKLKR